jgi:hypothetical protein
MNGRSDRGNELDIHCLGFLQPVRLKETEMFELVKSEVLPLTPDLAKQFKEMDPSPTERDLNPARLKMLREKSRQGIADNVQLVNGTAW